MEFKDIILKLRTERNLSQEELSKKLSASKSTIGMWETGKRFPSKALYEEIADFFNVDMDYLYGRTNVRKKIHFDNDGTRYIPYKDTFKLNETEKLVIECYRKADNVDKEMVHRILHIEEKEKKQNLLHRQYR